MMMWQRKQLKKMCQIKEQKMMIPMNLLWSLMLKSELQSEAEEKDEKENKSENKHGFSDTIALFVDACAFSVPEFDKEENANKV